MSFEEKSVWIQFVAMLGVLGGYFVVAGRMLAAGIDKALPFLAVFLAASAAMTAVLAVGHAAAALWRRPERRDERDRQIAWRAEAHSGWVLAAGAFAAIFGLAFSIGEAWVANLLMLSMTLSQLLCYALQLRHYRKGL